MAGQPFAPIGLIADGMIINASTANAINSHMKELLTLRQPDARDANGSVLAVVTFPKSGRLARSCDGGPWTDFQLRMSYEKLIALGSKKIQDMFTPRAQARFRRRLGLEQQLPPGIEYVVDFTPPSEGPELADLTAALWLPRVIKLWFLAGQYVPDHILETATGVMSRPLADRPVGAILVLGHDDVCKNTSCLTDVSEWETKENLPGIIDDNPPLGLKHIPAWRKVEDYCPIRHRVAIARLLRAINGDSLLLNSAVRLWTIAQVAISLDLPQIVRDPVAQWLVAPPNTKFIEICPERAFQLAYDLKIPSVLIAAFKILVNELAVDYASSEPLPGRPAVTWCQRQRDDYGDYPSDPVEYASRAFAERMSGQLQMLQSDNVFGRLPKQIQEWDKLDYLGSLIHSQGAPEPLVKAYLVLTTGLRKAFREWIDKAISTDYHISGHTLDLIAAQRQHYIAEHGCIPITKLYEQLNPSQRILTPFFWDRLMWVEPYQSFCNTLYAGKSISLHTINFNNELRMALNNSVIQPNLDHPAVSACFPHFYNNNNNEYNTYETQRVLYFSLPEFHSKLAAAVKQLCTSMLNNNREDGIPFYLSDHLLLSLDEHELNYLPIWADGLDDGSGGVFQDAIPEAEMGPSEPGPGYHTGYTVQSTMTMTDEGDEMTDYLGVRTAGAPSTIAPSEVGGRLGRGMEKLALSSNTGSIISTPLASETAGRSVDVQRSGQSTSTSGVTGATPSSEGFTADLEEEGMLYADARLAQPAAHQAQGQAIERYVYEADEGGGGGASASGEDSSVMVVDRDSDEEREWDSDDGSSTLDGFEGFEDVDVSEGL